jgi:hypothetical protein
MKIDKVIFSTSETFSVFWNLNSRLYKTKLGIEPVCLLFGDRTKTNMSEEFGQVIEMPILPDLPLLIQITWSKFHWPVHEPETTWLIGDIDLLPIGRRWFTTQLAEVPEDNYVHLDADGIVQLSRVPYSWTQPNLRPENLVDLGCPTNLPGHYHCARGKTFQIGLEQDRPFEDELRHIVTSGLYNNSRSFRESDPIEQHNLWCAEELRSSKALRRSIFSGKVKFTGFSLQHGIGRITGDRIDRTMYDAVLNAYQYDPEKLKRGDYVDLHCVRPFAHYLDAATCQRQWEATENLLQAAGMLP